MLLMQLFTLFSYLMDGFARCRESLAGRYVGAGIPDAAQMHPLPARVESRCGDALYVGVYAFGWADDPVVVHRQHGHPVRSRSLCRMADVIPLIAFAPFMIDGI